MTENDASGDAAEAAAGSLTIDDANDDAVADD